MKANEMQYFSDLSDIILYMFRTCPLSIIRSISNCIHAIVFVMPVLLAVC